MTSELKAAYEAVKALADRQLTALEDEDLDFFWALTAERDATFERLQALEPQLATLGAEEKAEIMAMIPTILLADDRIESHLSRHSQAARQELQQLQAGMTALQSYAVGREREAFFIDRPS